MIDFAPKIPRDVQADLIRMATNEQQRHDSITELYRNALERQANTPILENRVKQLESEVEYLKTEMALIEIGATLNELESKVAA